MNRTSNIDGQWKKMLVKIHLCICGSDKVARCSPPGARSLPHLVTMMNLLNMNSALSLSLHRRGSSPTLLGNRQEELEFRWKFFLRVQTIREVNTSDTTVGM